MPYENELKFALFKNDKGDNQLRPDYRGTITVGGVEYALSGWIAEVKSGKNAGSKYIRGQAQVAKSRSGEGRSAPASKPAPATAPQANESTEDVPF